MNSIPFTPDWGTQTAPSPRYNPAPVAPTPKVEFGLGRKVIIAEDDPVSREILVSLLSKWGYHVIPAHDGREAMEALRAQTGPVLAVLDWMMPGMEGTEICRRVREVNKTAYIILLTARSGKERLVEGLQAGADDYVVKPFDKDELKARLTVGARVMDLQRTLAERVAELEAVVAENHELRLQLPI